MMMLRKRTRSHHKDQAISEFPNPQSDSFGHNRPKSITNPLFTFPGLIIGLSNKGLSDSDSVRSPTSPLEFRVSSTMKTEPDIRSPRSSSQCGHHLGPTKVGLSIVDSLGNDRSLSREVLFGPTTRIKPPKKHTSHGEQVPEPKSLPKGFPLFPSTQKIKNHTGNGRSGVVFEIGDDPSESELFGLKNRSFSLGSLRSFSTASSLAQNGTGSSSESDSLRNRVLSPSRLAGESKNSSDFSGSKLRSNSGSIGSDIGFPSAFSASDMELSEDYTCIISHGPNPKTTHLYGDRVLECHDNGCKGLSDDKEKHISTLSAFTQSDSVYSDEFLSFCDFCNKKLEDGKDIYMYRGEKAFCSLECRSQEMLMEEDEEPEETLTIDEPLRNSEQTQMMRGSNFAA